MTDKQKRFQYNTAEWKRTSAAVIKRDNHTCQACGTTEGRMTADHIVPRSKGGTDDMTNLRCLCLSCNSSKGNRDKPRETWLNRAWLT